MSTPVIYVNDGSIHSTLLDFREVLPGPSQLNSVTSIQVYPDDGTLVKFAQAESPLLVRLSVGNGTQDVQYGVTVFCLTTMGETVCMTAAVVVSTDWASNVASRDSNSFVALVEDVLAGDSALGKASFQFPADFDASNGEVSWALVDREGLLHASGNAFNYTVVSSSFSTLVEASAVVGIPSSLPPTSEGNAYQLRWSLKLPDSPTPTYSFQALKVSGLTSAPEGTEPQVELEGDSISMALVVPNKPAYVSMEIFGARNVKLVPRDTVTVLPPLPTSGGFLYRTTIDPLNIVADQLPFKATLDPFLCVWLYRNTGMNSTSFMRQTTEVWVLTPSILGAVEDIRRRVMKARTTLFQFADMLFDTGTILGWLRRARDQFNGASGMFTEFDMTNATGIIREYWLQYAESEMLQAQALAEGEKAFDFQGAEISLSVERSQYYQTASDNLRQRLDNEIKPVKVNLLKKGAISGNGDMSGVAASGYGASRLGISITPASQIARNRAFYRNW